MADFVLTKEHVLAAARARFFTDAVAPDVTWHMAGSAHSLAGTRHSLRAYMAATFDRLGPRLRAPIRFDVTRVVVDAGPGPDRCWWARVETRGHAVRLASGLPYDNEYIWLTRWDARGKMVEIRSYCDTMLAEEVLREPLASEA